MQSIQTALPQPPQQPPSSHSSKKTKPPSSSSCNHPPSSKIHHDGIIPNNNPFDKPHDPSNYLRILAVSDIDVSSASELAEYALRQEYELDLMDADDDADRNDEDLIGGGQVDVCFVIGPLLRHSNSTTSTTPNNTRTNNNNNNSRETNAADEGSITAALLQLETIVCRVCYIPGYWDPSTLFHGSSTTVTTDTDTDTTSTTTTTYLQQQQ